MEFPRPGIYRLKMRNLFIQFGQFLRIGFMASEMEEITDKEMFPLAIGWPIPLIVRIVETFFLNMLVKKWNNKQKNEKSKHKILIENKNV